MGEHVQAKAASHEHVTNFLKKCFPKSTPKAERVSSHIHGVKYLAVFSQVTLFAPRG